MDSINNQRFLDEIKQNIKENDQIKARLVLKHLHEIDMATQRRVLMDVARAQSGFALPVIAGLIVENPEIVVHHPAIFDLLTSKVLEDPKTAADLLLSDCDVGVKARLAEAVGEARIKEAVGNLKKILTVHTDKDLLKATLEALGKIGGQEVLNAVVEYLYSADKDLILTAARALKRIGTPAAVEKLGEKLGTDPELDVAVLLLIASIKIPEAISALNKTLVSGDDRIRNVGKQRLAEIGPAVIPMLEKNLSEDDADLLIHTLNVLGDINHEDAVGPIRNLLFWEPPDANVRFAAYEALGRLPLGVKSYALAPGLQDPEASVRAAAAGAIDNSFNKVLAAGVRNLVEPGDEEAHNITITIIDAFCDNIFSELIETPFFKENAINYLTRKAHPEVREHFVDLLWKIGYPGQANEIKENAVTIETGKLKVFAVDDSPMTLKIYRTMLHGLGYEPYLFEFPNEAMEKLHEMKPDMVLTDLNMPVITGIDLARGIRKLYSEKELPVVMVTTQSDGPDHKAAIEAGVNEVINKPFTKEAIGMIVEKYIRRT